MKSQRRFAPKGGRIESESVAGLAGISIQPDIFSLRPKMQVSFVVMLARK